MIIRFLRKRNLSFQNRENEAVGNSPVVITAMAGDIDDDRVKFLEMVSSVLSDKKRQKESPAVAYHSAQGRVR